MKSVSESIQILRHFKRRSFMFIAIASLGVSVLFLGFIYLNNKHYVYGELLNKSGKQRMYSQHIVLLSITYNQNPSPQTKLALFEAVQKMRSDHDRIDELMRLSKNTRISNDAFALCENNNLLLNQFWNHAANVATSLDTQSQAWLVANHTEVLSFLDTIMSIIQNSYENDLSAIEQLGVVVLVFLVLFVLLSYFIIVYPGYITFSNVIRQIDKMKIGLEKAQTIVKIGSWQWKNSHKEMTWSKEVYHIIGITPTSLASNWDNFLELTHPQDRQFVQSQIFTAIKKRRPFSFDHRIILPDGEVRTVHEKGDVYFNTDKSSTLISTIQDVTQMRILESTIEENKKLMNRFLISSSTDNQGIITAISDAFCIISGYEHYELIGKNHNIIRHPDTPKELFENLWHTLLKGEIWEGEVSNQAKNGSTYWVYSVISPIINFNNECIGYTAIYSDISDKKKLQELALSDELTSLYNRRYFNQIFTKEINCARRNHTYFVFFLMDIDNFKMYNDTYGHQEGDAVLQAIGNVLKKSLKRGGDYAFRLGGEEFGGIFTVEEPIKAHNLVESIRINIENLAIPHCLNSFGVVTASFGVFVSSLLSDISSDTIYKQADIALYTAKKSGRNCIEVTHV